MGWFASLSIRNKLITIIVGVSLSVVTVIGGFELAWESNRAKAELEHELTAVAKLITSRSSAAIVFDDEKLARDNLEALSVISNVMKACLYRANGSLLSVYIRTDLKQDVSCDEKNTIAESNQFYTDSGFVMNADVLLGSKNVGHLVLLSDLSTVDDHLHSQVLFTMLAVIVALLASILMALVLQKLISDPLLNITKVAQAIEDKGEYGLRAEVGSKDELGRLARTFNSMLDTLAYRNKELMDTKDEQIAASVLYRNLVSSTSAIPWELDLSTWLFTYVGKQAESVFGYPVKDWYKENFWANHLHPEDRERSIEYCQTSTANKQDHQFEYRLKKPDGQYVWIHDDVQVVLENDRPVRLQGFMFDITERKRQEEAIKNIATGVSAETGESFYQQLVMQMANLFDATYAFVGMVNKEKTDVSTMAFCVDGEIVDNISFRLKGTPCANVIDNTTCSYTENVQELFPEDKLLSDMDVQSYIGAPMLNADGDVLGLIVVLGSKPMRSTEQMQEILQIFSSRASAELQRTRADEKLLRAQKKLSLHIQQTPLGVIEWDKDFKVVDWNPGAEKIFGYSRREAIGKSGQQLILTDELSSQVSDVWEALISNQGGGYNRNENITKDGRQIMCEWFNTSLTTETGEVIGVASFVLDITSEQATQAALQLKEVEQREILDTMIDGVITLDVNGTILSCNKASEQIFECAAGELIGEDIKQIIPGFFEHDDVFQLQSRGQSVENERVIGTTRETSARRKDGFSFPVRLSVAELADVADRNNRYICSCQDITNEKQQEEQLHRSQKMDALGKLTGGVAHDYNNMLGVVLGYAEILEVKLADNPKLAAYAKEIHKAGDRGAKLSQKLLAFSRNKMSDAEVVDINHLLLEEKNMLEKTLTARVRLEFELQKEVWPVKLDVSDLEDAILNMSINAMHAIEDHGVLTISTENKTLSELDSKMLNVPEGEYVVINLTDTGCGMDEATKGKVFEPFFSTKGAKGTGLGLSQVYGFLTRNDGAIKIYSEPGHGTRFSLYFPRHLTSPAEQEGCKPENEYNLQGAGKILVVDDEPQLLLLTEEILKTNGYQVLTANRAKVALEILESEQIDLLITDIIMPEMDGYELAAIVQKKYPEVKIQLASGFADDRHVNLVDEYLHDTLLHKPFNTSNLLQRIKELLET